MGVNRESYERPFVALLLACAAALIVWGNFDRKSRSYSFVEVEFTLPVPIQLLGAMGDRYLAANIAIWRAIVMKPERMTPEMLGAMAKLQTEASWLNPGHEDNYYIAAAILPWAGQVGAAQTILARATQARPKDEYPPFFLGFNRMYFLGDYRGAAAAAATAAAHAQAPGTRQALLSMAAKWAERDSDIEVAKKILAGIAKSTPDLAAQHEVALRIERLATLAKLRMAAKQYRQEYGTAPTSIDDLVKVKLIDGLPDDPLGIGFAVVGGEPVIRSHVSRKHQAPPK